MDLRTALLQERLSLYVRLRGGYTFPLAGGIWCASAAALGGFVPLRSWALLAFIGSGLIFPIALVLSRLLSVDFMNQKSAVDGAIAPAFFAASMRARLPSKSTVVTLSAPPRCTEFAVVITVVTPRQAASSEEGSFRSPVTI